MPHFFHRAGALVSFYRRALTRYQLHSPFVFQLANEVLEDRRMYYAYRDVEAVREAMLRSSVNLEVEDLGAGASSGTRPLRERVQRSASSPEQGRRLFRLARWAAPRTILEIGTSTGVGAMYLASAAREARFVGLEGSAALAAVARENLQLLGLKQAEVRTGAFEQTLPGVLESLETLDFVFFDGNHRAEPTLQYFEQCLACAHAGTVFVFDDVYWSPEMTDTWHRLQAHPRTTLTIDLYDLALLFVNPDFKEKQHLSVVPARWKPWRVF